ncbi:MAG: ATPase domain-containing protein [Candidatus Bathyarchaeia archaeon]
MGSLQLAKSGVPGLDEVAGGGLPRGRCITLHGGPGSGKTILSIQFLYKGAVDYDENGVFVSLSENPAEIRANMNAFGWNLEKLEKEGKLAMVDARPVTLTEEGFIAPTEELFREEVIPFSHITRLVNEKIAQVKAQRIVVDSVTVLTMQYKDRFYVRQGILGLVQALTRTGCTALIVSEGFMERPRVNLEIVLVPGVILLHYARKGEGMVRAIQVLKMRGMKHSEQLHHMEIGDNGIVVHPTERVEL